MTHHARKPNQSSVGDSFVAGKLLENDSGIHRCLEAGQPTFAPMSSLQLNGDPCANVLGLQATLEGRPGPAYVDVPSDVLFAEAPAQEVPHIGSIRPVDYSQPSPLLHRPRAPEAGVRQAADLLRKAQRYGKAEALHSV